MNTLYLGTRPTTSDVDFFYRTKLKNEDVSKIILAADAAAQKLKLGDGWLNNHTAIFIEVIHHLFIGIHPSYLLQQGMVATLYEEALAQNEVIFYQKGLRVYAAPWRYALMTKMDRLGKGSRRDYDLSDAVGYLHKLVGKRGRAVSRSELKEWAVSFKFSELKDNIIDEVAKAYKTQYKSDGIV